ncbi:MAG: hypothetical protein WBA45_06700 [Microthrixaceae bacterium]
MNRTIAAAVAATAAITYPSVAPAGALDSESVHDQTEGVVADFEGRRINLAEGWGDAEACRSDDEGTRCYRSATQMYNAEHLFANAGAIVASICSGDVNLYSDASYAGTVLSLNTRSVVINLAGYGFDNVTSSYKIGPCGSRFYDTTTGSGLYPGTTTANTVAASMSPGWDNRIGSITIS